MRANRWIIDHAPLQIYASALIFSPHNSVIRSQFTDLMPHWITQKPTTEETWTPLITTLGGQTSCHLVASSPTEDLVASVSSNGMASLWDYITGTERFKFEKRGPGRAQCVSFSADGKRIAIGLDNGSLQVSEFAKGKVIELRDHEESIWHVTFSPRDNGILASVGICGTRLIWSVDERRIIHKCSYSCADVFPGPVSFSGDGSLVYFAGYGTGDPPVLMSVETGDCIKVPETWEYDSVLTTAFSIDGQTVATAMMETVTIKDLSTGIQRFQGPSKHVTHMAFSPDGKVLALVIDQPHIIEVHDLKTWAVIGSFYTTGWIRQIAFCRDGKTIVSCGRAGLQLWDTSSITKEPPVEILSPFESLMFLPKSNDLLLSCSTSGSRSPSHGLGAGQFQLWDLAIQKSKLLLTVEGLDELGNAIFSPDGQLVALMWSSCDLGSVTVKLIEIETGRDRGNISHTNSGCYEPVFHMGSQLLVSVKDGHFITGWDTKSLSEKFCFEGSDSGSTASWNLLITPTGQLVVGKNVYDGNQFSMIHQWEISTGKEIGRYRIEGLASGLQLSDDGRYLTSPRGRLPLPSSITSGEKAYSGEFQKDWQDLYLGGQWVFQALTRLLWLPPQLQGVHWSARGETVAFKAGDGGVGVIKFDLAKTPLATGRSSAV